MTDIHNIKPYNSEFYKEYLPINTVDKIKIILSKLIKYGENEFIKTSPIIYKAINNKKIKIYYKTVENKYLKESSKYNAEILILTYYLLK